MLVFLFPSYYTVNGQYVVFTTQGGVPIDIKTTDLLLSMPLFAGFSAEELPDVLQCLGAAQRRYPKEAFILLQGDAPRSIGVVLAGSVQVLREDAFGHRSILDTLDPGDLFAEIFAFARVPSLPVSVQALRPCRVLLLQPDHFASTRVCAPCTHHARLVSNMLAVLAQKTLALNATLGHLSRRTMREKLLSYLSAQAQVAHSRRFTIPLSRQQLADYLYVDRSALSAELGRMQKDGLVRFHKNEFELL